MGFSSEQQLYEDLFKTVIDDLAKNLERRGIVMNLKEKVYQVIMNELNIKEDDNFIIQYYTDGSRKELECVFKNGELKNATTYDNLSGKMLAILLAPNTVLKKKPWIPKYGDSYYWYSPQSKAINHYHFSSHIDIGMYKNNNCFKREEDITDEDKARITQQFNEFFGE